MYCNTAQEMLDYLLGLQDKGINLDNVSLSFRPDEDSDVEQINFVGEGCYDAETNSVLTEIMFYTEIEDFDDEN
jgi:O-glycosyl hydrolase